MAIKQQRGMRGGGAAKAQHRGTGGDDGQAPVINMYSISGGGNVNSGVKIVSGWNGGKGMKVLRFLQSVGARKARRTRSISNILNLDKASDDCIYRD